MYLLENPYNTYETVFIAIMTTKSKVYDVWMTLGSSVLVYGTIDILRHPLWSEPKAIIVGCSIGIYFLVIESIHLGVQGRYKLIY